MTGDTNEYERSRSHGLQLFFEPHFREITGELGRYIAGIGDVSPTFLAFVIALKSYDDAEKWECFDAFSKAAALYEEKL